jgi:hypothetical protein
MVDTFVWAIETSDFERRLPVVDAGFPARAGGLFYLPVRICLDLR